MRPGPPKWAEAVLAALLTPPDRDAVLEELTELFEVRCAQHGAPAARRWYRRQVLVFAVELARHGRRLTARDHRTRFQEALAGRAPRGGGGMEGWLQELGRSARRLGRAPVFTGVSVLTIGIGIGMFASVFSLVEGVLLRPLPYDRPEELAWVWRDYVEADFPRGWLGGPDVAGLAEQPDVVTDVVALRTGTLNLGGGDGGAPAEVVAHYATPGLFELLGVPLLIGREPEGAETEPDGPEVAVLSHDLWRTRFGADPAIVGRTILLDDVTTEVVGVTPEQFRFVKHGSLSEPIGADLYLPYREDLSTLDAGAGSFAALVRLDPAAHPDRIEAALATAARPANDLFRQFDGSPVRLWTVGLEEDLVASVRPALWALTGSAAFLLLVLTANLATLLLGRATVRERELGIRLALGAGRSSVLGSVVTEAGLLAGVGGALGIAIACLGTDLVVALAPSDLPRLGDVRVDVPVLVTAAAATLVMGLVAGLLPCLRAARHDVVTNLREGGARSGGSVRGVRTRSLLVTSQVALSLMLLVGAGLTAQAFARLVRADPGFDPTGTLTFRVPFVGEGDSQAEALAFHDALRERIAALPGTEAVGASNALPLTMTTSQRGVSFPGAPGNSGDDRLDTPLTDNFRITPGYLAAAGHRLLSGRDFDAMDADTAALSVIIDDVLADRFFPDGAAVGSRMSIFGDTATIVGVVDQARLYSVHEDDRGQVYVPFQRLPSGSMSYAVRTRIEPAGLVAPIRSVLEGLDPTVPMAQVRTLQSIVDDSLGQQRLSLTLITTFALGALLLAALGIYGVVSNAVTRRTREIGVRMALGASGDSVVGLVLGQGLRLSLAGAVLGILGALAGARVLRGVVPGLDPSSPLVYGAVAAGLVAVAALASYLPAQRATRIDPLAALRPE